MTPTTVIIISIAFIGAVVALRLLLP
ncbi:MAG: hypothetical protein QW765_03080 [Fervidicoccaceae archaeon]